jgi:hypothetical protein
VFLEAKLVAMGSGVYRNKKDPGHETQPGKVGGGSRASGRARQGQFDRSLRHCLRGMDKESRRV